MPSADFFARFGLFVAEHFLDADLCRRICDQACSLSWKKAVIYRAADRVVDEDVRRTLAVKLPETERNTLKERLLSLKPTLERYFNLALAGFEEPNLLRYTEGSFFTAHQDSTSEPNSNEHAKRRQVSLTIFLNNQAEQPAKDSYCGGSLIFYGLMNDPRAKHCGFPLRSETGLLVAFRSDITHEVKPITSGERFSVVSWFF
jgi:predicted 2-oxoglutarate/Fe(II)-dependent dioxygenase YbiX